MRGRTIGPALASGLGVVAIVGATMMGPSAAPQPAGAASTGILSPVSTTSSTGWTAHSSQPHFDGTMLSAIADTTCSAADRSYMTGTYLSDATFRLDLSSIPEGAWIGSVNVTVCYSDDDGQDEHLLQSVAPMMVGVGDVYPPTTIFGAAIDPAGSTNIVSSTQRLIFSGNQVNAGLDGMVVRPGGTLDIGVRDTGFTSRVRVYSIWAVLNYDPTPTFSIDLTISGLDGTSGPYRPEQELMALIRTYSTGAVHRGIEVHLKFDAGEFRVVNAPGCYGFGIGPEGDFTCYSMSNVLQIRVNGPSPCDRELRGSVVYLGVTVAQATQTVEIQCGDLSTPSPTTTATPTSTATVSPSPTGTIQPTASSSATSTQSTATPTRTGTATATTTPHSGTPHSGTPGAYSVFVIEVAEDGE